MPGWNERGDTGGERKWIQRPVNQYSLSGNRISVRTLDMDREFREIAVQLDEIVASEKMEALMAVIKKFLSAA